MARKSRRSSAARFLPDFSDPVARVVFIRRTGLTVVTAGLAYCAAASAVVGVTRFDQPQIATTLSANDPRALVELAARKIADGQTKSADALLRRALAEQPLLPKAIGLMAAIAYQDKRQSRAFELMTSSRQLSRRDAVTNQLLIKHSAEIGDVSNLLKHYDVALRTDAELNQQLAPQLAAALDVAEFKPYFSSIVKNRPPWLGHVVNTALLNTKNPAQLADILMTAGRLPDAKNQATAETALLTKLAEVNDWPMLRRYYLSLAKASPALLVDPGFSAKTIDPARAPISWVLFNDAGVEAGFFGGSVNTKLKGVAFNGTRGVFAAKRLLLAPANYTFSVKASGFDAKGGAQAWASLFCFTSEGRQPIGTVTLGNGVNQAQFSVSGTCAAQALELGIAGGDRQDGAEITIDSVALHRL